jgi:hypothetical protein
MYFTSRFGLLYLQGRYYGHADGGARLLVTYEQTTVMREPMTPSMYVRVYLTYTLRLHGDC